MTEARLMRGNDAIAEASVRAGCRFIGGYPLTPATEILEYLSSRMPEVGGVCVQAESELAAINMVYGASAAGVRAMTATSGLGLSLMQEGLSQMCAVELPGVVVDMARMGPGLGTLSPSQADYYLATRGTGHGDSRAIVLAPSTVQEAADLTYDAFDLADRYRNPVLVLGDALIAQVLEPVHFPEMRPLAQAPYWAVPGWREGAPNVIGEYRQDLASVEESVRKLERKYAAIEAAETRAATFATEEAEVLIVAFGTAARVALHVAREARREGQAVGLFRPISLWPFPRRQLQEAARSARAVLVSEMSLGQMIDDVRLSLPAGPEVILAAHPNGAPSPDSVRAHVVSLLAS